MPDYSIAVEPLDPIVFGDNGLGQGAGYSSDLHVFPTTLHGAIGGLIWKECGGPNQWPQDQLGPRHADILRPATSDKNDVVAASAQLRGYCFRGLDGHRWFTRPQHLPIRVSKSSARLDFHTVGKPPTIEPNSNVRSSNPYSCLITHSEVIDEYEGDLIVDEGLMKSVLCGQKLGQQLKTGVSTPHSTLLRGQSRVGIAIDHDTGRTIEGQLFVRDLKRLATGSLNGDQLSAGYEAWLRTPGKLPEFADCSVGKLGGEGRRAKLSFAQDEEPLGALKEAVIKVAENKDTRGFFLYLLTPAIYEAGDVHYKNVLPVAAALGKPWRYSGWNTKLGQPRSFVSMVPAGSVYFFEWPDDKTPADVISTQWLEPLPQLKQGDAPLEPAIAGFGRNLVGVWS